MVKIENLKDYIGKVSDEELMSLATKIYMITDHIKNDYPQHYAWFFKKQLKETITRDTRNILFVKNPNNENDVIAMACLKRDDEESKLCTLYVKENFRNNKIGFQLFEESFKWLGTTKPLASIPQEKYESFKPIIEKYDWELCEIIDDYYKDGSKELCFNGSLIKSNNKTK